MLQDLDKTLEKLFYQQGRLSKNDIDVAFDRPDGEWSARLNRPTLSCWCYDVRENMKLRNPELFQRQMPNGKSAQYRMPPRRIDLSFLVTAWARKIEDEKQLLWRALYALVRTPKLEPRACEGDLRNQPIDIPIGLVNMADHPVNLTDLWSVLDNEMKLGFPFVVTLALDPDMVTDEPPLVLEAFVRVGQAPRPQDRVLGTRDVEIKHDKDSIKEDE